LVGFCVSLGFARSSRPQFSNDPLEAEEQYVAIIEAWRIKMNLDKMVLVGHSFGGFLSFAYTLKHPERFEDFSLILFTNQMQKC
jgi:pimeloyl-ACP methyl ester carboxylesterase